MTLDMTWEHREEMIRRDERAEGREEGLLAGIEQQRRADEILLEAKNAEIARLQEEIQLMKMKGL